MEKIATRDSFNEVLPMPAEKARLNFTRTFAADEFRQISRGFVPQDMEDKWFIFLEGDDLFFHRSWTGMCIYHVRVERRDDKVTVTDAWVNRNKEQYNSRDDAYDAKLLGFLIDDFLLEKETPFPLPPDQSPGGIFQHHISGSGFPEKRTSEDE